MSIWGKIIGGTAGFALGGPIGALVGVAAGHFIDRAAARARLRSGDATAASEGSSRRLMRDAVRGGLTGRASRATSA